MNVNKAVQNTNKNKAALLFLAPAPDPAAEAGLLAGGIGAAGGQFGVEGRHLQMVDGQVVEERLAGDGLEVGREVDKAALAARQVRILTQGQGLKYTVPRYLRYLFRSGSSMYIFWIRNIAGSGSISGS